jgi:hypothetical protein
MWEFFTSRQLFFGQTEVGLCWVLVSTSLFDVINMSEQILLDGELVDIKIIEEWGFHLGEDACLSEVDAKSVVCLRRMQRWRVTGGCVIQPFY